MAGRVVVYAGAVEKKREESWYSDLLTSWQSRSGPGPGRPSGGRHAELVRLDHPEGFFQHCLTYRRHGKDKDFYRQLPLERAMVQQGDKHKDTFRLKLHGDDSGRIYVFRVESPELAQVWAGLIAQASKGAVIQPVAPPSPVHPAGPAGARLGCSRRRRPAAP